MSELIGKKLLGIRPLTEIDCRLFGFDPWGYEGGVVLMFEGGAQMVASQDFEGNGPGALFYRKGRKTFTLVFQQEPNEKMKKLLDGLEEKSAAIKKAPKKKAKAGKKKAS
jgi:hypothetical protein